MRFLRATLPRAPSAPLVVGSLVAAAYALLTLEWFWFRNAVPVAVGGVLGLGAACYYALRPQTLVAHQGREGATAPRRSGWGRPAALGCLTGGLFLAIGWSVLSTRQPAEDAYILFRYAEHLAEGHGIVFNVGGPRAEGATDFLWLLLVSGLTAAGLDVAIAALALNSLGAGLTGGLLAHVVLAAPGLPPAARAGGLLGVPLLVVLFHGAAAAYVGFSTMLYASLIALLYWIATTQRGPGVCWLPILGVIVGLLRPDGVVVGAAFALLGVWWVDPAWRRRYVQGLLLSGLVGLAYFVWRYAYFGLWLPLPLLVKSRAVLVEAWDLEANGILSGLIAHLPGLEDQLSWLTSRVSPLPPLALITGLALFLHRVQGSYVRRVIVALLPLGCLGVALCFGEQSQNVFFRFQAPVSLVLVFALVQLGVLGIWYAPWTYQRLTLLAVVLPVAVLPLSRGLSLATVPPDGDYMDTFAPMFGASVAGDAVLALTQAGRLPYWYEGRVVDLIGLNTPDTATVPPSLAYLEAVAPDLVMFSIRGRLELPVPRGGPFTRTVSAAELAAAVAPRLRRVLARGLANYADSQLSSGDTATILATRYLINSGAYDIVAVDPDQGGQYQHVYGFRKGWLETRSTITMLEAAGRNDRDRSYLAIRRRSVPRGRRPAR